MNMHMYKYTHVHIHVLFTAQCGAVTEYPPSLKAHKYYDAGADLWFWRGGDPPQWDKAVLDSPASATISEASLSQIYN